MSLSRLPLLAHPQPHGLYITLAYRLGIGEHHRVSLLALRDECGTDSMPGATTGAHRKQQVDPGDVNDGSFCCGPSYQLSSLSRTAARLDVGFLDSILISPPPGLVPHLSTTAASTPPRLIPPHYPLPHRSSWDESWRGKAEMAK